MNQPGSLTQPAIPEPTWNPLQKAISATNPQLQVPQAADLLTTSLGPVPTNIGPSPFIDPAPVVEPQSFIEGLSDFGNTPISKIKQKYLSNYGFMQRPKY